MTIRRSCWRCSPWLRRIRLIIETNDAIRLTLIRRNPIEITTAAAGLCSSAVLRSYVVGDVNIKPSTEQVPPITAIQTAYRQRGDSR